MATDNYTGGSYRAAMCPGCGTVLSGSREPGDTDTCNETGEEVVLEEVDWIAIVEDDERARSHFRRPLGKERPQGPTVEVPADLLAELTAYADRENWVASNVTCQEAREALRSLHTGSNQGGKYGDSR